LAVQKNQFTYGKELRFFTFIVAPKSHSFLNEVPKKAGLGIYIEPEAAIEKIFIGPSTPDYFVDVVEAALGMAGYNLPVSDRQWIFLYLNRNVP